MIQLAIEKISAARSMTKRVSDQVIERNNDRAIECCAADLDAHFVEVLVGDVFDEVLDGAV